MTEQKCAKIVAGEGLVSLTGPNFYEKMNKENSFLPQAGRCSAARLVLWVVHIELPTTVFVVYKYFPFDEAENVVSFISEDDVDEFVRTHNKLKDGYNYGVEKLELKW